MFKFLRSARLSAILLAVVVLLIFLHYAGVVKPIENLVARMLAPIQQQVYLLGTKFNSLYSNIYIGRDLVAENKRLTDENKGLLINNSQLKTQLQEVKEEKLQQDFLASTGLQAITARVIGKNPQPSLQAIILNKGSRDGVKVDFPLITADGVIIGKISQVKTNSSEAILVNDSRSRIASLVQNENNSKGVVVGEHGLSLKIELIPQNEKVQVGDIVVTSGLEPTIPRGLVVGKINRVTSEPNSFFQTAWLQSLTSINDLITVSILITPDYD